MVRVKLQVELDHLVPPHGCGSAQPFHDRLQCREVVGVGPARHPNAGSLLDGCPRHIDVARVVVIEVDDEDSAVALTAQQAFLDQPLHRLADRSTTDMQLSG